METNESMNYIEFTNEQLDQITEAMDERDDGTIQEFILWLVKSYRYGLPM